MELDHKKILVIGGSGFVGSFLIDKLKDFKVRNIDKNKSPFYNKITTIGDIRNIDDLKFDKKISTVVLLAAEHRDDVSPTSLYYDVNVQGTKNVLKAMDNVGVNNIIFTSSVAVYGFAKPGTDENGQINPFNEYGRTKFDAEEKLRAWRAEGKNSLIIVRPTVIFGEGNRGNVYNLLSQIARRRFIMFGKGTNKKSMAYVENVASFLEYTCNFENGYHVYNYIDKPDFNMNELVSKSKLILFGKEKIGIRLPAWLGTSLGIFADILAMILGKKLPISSIRVKKFMSTTQFSTSISDTFFVPPISIENGLKNTLKYEFIEDNSRKRKFYSE